jgi:ferritin-like metal-binding protein YciE
MAEKDLKALFVHQLKDTYFAENAILKTRRKGVGRGLDGGYESAARPQ